MLFAILTTLSSALVFAKDWDQVSSNLNFWGMFSSTVNMVIPEPIPFYFFYFSENNLP